MISLRIVLKSVKVAAFISLLTFGFGTPVLAEDDLSDNETCLDCHEDADRAPPSNPDRPQVHNPAGGFFGEDHADFSCNDCHTYITDLEHEETAPGQEVDCLECHDEVPTKE
jgi:hypothetical protein